MEEKKALFLPRNIKIESAGRNWASGRRCSVVVLTCCWQKKKPTRVQRGGQGALVNVFCFLIWLKIRVIQREQGKTLYQNCSSSFTIRKIKLDARLFGGHLSNWVVKFRGRLNAFPRFLEGSIFTLTKI